MEECRNFDLRDMPTSVRTALQELQEMTESLERFVITNSDGTVNPVCLNKGELENLNKNRLVGAIWFRS